jgi:hypothetical protein
MIEQLGKGAINLEKAREHWRKRGMKERRQRKG